MNSLLFHTCSCLVHLSRLEVAVDMYAPDVPQMHVIDHCKGEPAEGETRSEKKITIKSTDRILHCTVHRNVLVESARIARGNISPLSSLKAADYNGVVFPGGFGAAKNL